MWRRLEKRGEGDSFGRRCLRMGLLNKEQSYQLSKEESYQVTYKSLI